MRAIAKEMDVGSMTIVRTIHEDLGLKSYALRKGQLLTENMKNNRKGKAAALLNNLKHDAFGMLRFFSDEKNFDVDQKVNPRNDRWICKDPSEIPVVMHTKFPASVMVLGVISSEGDVMPPHFFEKGLRMNADTYINVLETVVKPWMNMVAAGRKYVFQQDSAPAHKAKKTQSWLTLNVPSHWGPDIWPPNSPDCNPLDYYVWGVVERDVNKAPHTTIQSVKKAVHTVMTQMDKVIVAKACASSALASRLFSHEGFDIADAECDEPSESGSCRGHFPRYYHSKGVCKSFVYGGCDGNKNNFETKEECEEACISKGRVPSYYTSHLSFYCKYTAYACVRSSSASLQQNLSKHLFGDFFQVSTIIDKTSTNHLSFLVEPLVRSTLAYYFWMMFASRILLTLSFIILHYDGGT
ncbi:hypothetical protein LAZ67_23000403 [Cordylochernes scorpioides]|uniref:BPTI/Kunitz inhibitor domain-containing protein n=1 Tax=Cordylochernes scorpioides TaxID=51811 RepID=A0ABY6LU71_9ARAC|nr:hypothetical protein LAZ67_23000403 [Cordylochernes scorpioides]